MQFGAAPAAKRPCGPRADTSEVLPAGSLFAEPPEAGEVQEEAPGPAPLAPDFPESDPQPPVLEADRAVVDAAAEDVAKEMNAAANTMLPHNKQYAIFRQKDGIDEGGKWVGAEMDSRVRLAMQLQAERSLLEPSLPEQSEDSAIPLMHQICAKACLKGASQGEGLISSFWMAVRQMGTFENFVLAYFPASSPEVVMLKACENGKVPSTTWFSALTVKAYIHFVTQPKTTTIGEIEGQKIVKGLGNGYPAAPFPGGYSCPQRNFSFLKPPTQDPLQR